MVAVKDSRIAVRLSSHQDALIRRAAAVEGTSITEFTVAATMRHAIDVLANRRTFAIDDAARREFGAVLDRPVSHKPRLEKLFSEAVFSEERAATACPAQSPSTTTPPSSIPASPLSTSVSAGAPLPTISKARRGALSPAGTGGSGVTTHSFR